MQLLEYEGMALFRKYRIPTPFGLLADSVEAVVQFYESNGPTIIKAQVPFGGRGHAGLVKIARNKREAQKFAKEILGSMYKGTVVRQVWVSIPLEAEKEYYLAITFEDRPVVIFGPGGVDVKPYLIKKYEINGELPEMPFPQEIVEQLWTLFQREDATLAEINPLVKTKDGYFALDSKIIIDDYALFRHAVEPSVHVAGKAEQEAIEAGLQYVALDGNIGVMANGAGLTMHTLDCLGDLKPANFLDIGGGASPEKVAKALRILDSNPQVERILISIFAGITKCDEVAKGIIDARCTKPLFIRLAGTNDEQGTKLLRRAGLDAYPGLQQALEAMRQTPTKQDAVEAME